MPEQPDSRLTLPTGGAQTRLQVCVGRSPLRKTPDLDAEMVSQILLGETVTLHHQEGPYGLVQNLSDGYVGWTEMATLSASILPPTHSINVPLLHSYAAPSIRAAPQMQLGAGGRLTVTDQTEGAFVQCARVGWVHSALVAPIDQTESDPAAVAERLLGTPYLWGGREGEGIDCSGLVQLAYAACGISAPRDSDMQFQWFGEPLANWDTPNQLHRNDLIFWRGHVGIMLDPHTLLHANAHHMAVAQEPLPEAIQRIAPMYGQPIGARRVSRLGSGLEAGEVTPAWLTHLS